MVKKEVKKATKVKGKRAAKVKPVDARPENYFVLASGSSLKNLKELANALEKMDEWVFQHHVNESRNDFANWIADCLNEKQLAQQIRQINTIKELEARLFKHIVEKYI